MRSWLFGLAAEAHEGLALELEHLVLGHLVRRRRTRRRRAPRRACPRSSRRARSPGPPSTSVPIIIASVAIPLSPGKHVSARSRRMPARSARGRGARLRVGQLARAVEADARGAPEVAEGLRLFGARRDARHRDVLEHLRDERVRVDASPRRARPRARARAGSSCRRRRGRDPRRPRRGRRTSPPRPARRRRRGRPRARRRGSSRRARRRPGRVAYFIRWQASWKPFTIERICSHSFCCAAITTSNRFAPTQKCSPWLATTSARKSVSAFATESSIILMTSGSMLFAFVLKVSPSTPSPRSQASAPSFLSTGALPLRSAGSVAVRGSSGFALYAALEQVEDAPVGRVEALRARRRASCRSTRAGPRRPSSSDRRRPRSRGRPTSRRGRAPSCSPSASPHRSRRRRRRSRRCVAPSTRATARAPSTRSCPALPGVGDELAHALAYVFDLGRAPCSCAADFLVAAARPVLERLRIERLDRCRPCPCGRSRPWSCRRGASSRPSPGCRPAPRRPCGPRRP